MKVTITAIALAATAALSAPATAQVAPGALGAIAHFNQDFDTANQRVTIASGSGVDFSTRTGVSLAQARFNADFDGQDNVRKVSGGTSFGGDASRAQSVFARIAAESAENE